MGKVVTVQNYIDSKGVRSFLDGLTLEGKKLVKYHDWIITDVRFKNEAQAILERGGILIRINRFCFDSLEDYLVTHPNKEVSKKATAIVKDTVGMSYNFMEDKLKKIPESKGFYQNHPSETELDSYDKFHYTINNTGTIEELIEKVKVILTELNLI